MATQAHDALGIPELWDAIQRHRAFLAEGTHLADRRHDGLRRQLRALALDRLGRELDAACGASFMDGLVTHVADCTLDPDTAVDQVLDRLG